MKGKENEDLLEQLLPEQLAYRKRNKGAYPHP